MINRRQLLTSVAGISTLKPWGVLAAADSVLKTHSNETAYLYSDVFLQHSHAPSHPESSERLLAVRTLLQASDMYDKLYKTVPLHDSYPQLLSIHTQTHIDSIFRHEPQAAKVAVAVVSAAIRATELVCTGAVRNAFCASRPPGHHALNTGKEEGFCYFNAVAIAARYAQTVHRCNKIVIIDWDYHHGNGTELAFYDDPQVLFFSTHNLHDYPGTGDPARRGSGRGEGYTINVHLGCGSGDKDILSAFQAHLVPAVARFKPELILISAGFDSRTGDSLGCFDMTDAGFQALTKLVMQLADSYCDGKIVSILEGGYTPAGLAQAVLAHVETLAGV